MSVLFPDIPRIYTALAEWLSCLLYVSLFTPRFRTWRQWGAVHLVGGIQIALQLFAGMLPLLLWIPGMLMNIMWMLVSFQLLTKESKATSIFVGTKAFIVAELTAAIAWQSYCYVVLYLGTDYLLQRFFVMLTIYVTVFAIIYSVEKPIPTNQLGNILHRKETVVAVLTGVMIFAMGNVGFILTSSENGILYDSNTIFFIRSLVNISGFLILYTQQQHILDTYLRQELTAIQNVFQNQYEQYRAFNENNELIRKKVHDLKHQVAYLKHEQNEAKRNAYVQELETMIQNFDAKIETGNAVLDTVLTRKNQYCLQHGINLSCLVTGELLNAMDTMDLCTLFGNALDNAIEAVEKISLPDKKLISLKVTSKANFTIIRLDNYCEEKISFNPQSFPKTSKADTQNHGYGLKSMEVIVQKYGGTMTLTQEEQWVRLAILLPKELPAAS